MAKRFWKIQDFEEPSNHHNTYMGHSGDNPRPPKEPLLGLRPPSVQQVKAIGAQRRAEQRDAEYRKQRAQQQNERSFRHQWARDEHELNQRGFVVEYGTHKRRSGNFIGKLVLFVVGAVVVYIIISPFLAMALW